MPRIFICGGPRSGKSTFAKRLGEETGLQVISTDRYIGVSWENVPLVAVKALTHAPDWILEGIQAARVLRFWLNTQPDAQVTQVYWFNRAIVNRTARQEATAKGVATVFASVRGELSKRCIPLFESSLPHDYSLALAFGATDPWGNCSE